MIAKQDSADALERAIHRYNDAWNAHDLRAIVSMHAPDMTFENHTAGESAQGEGVRRHIATIAIYLSIVVVLASAIIDIVVAYRDPRILRAGVQI